MGTSGTESSEGCLKTQFKYVPPQLALKLSLVGLQNSFFSFITNVFFF